MRQIIRSGLMLLGAIAILAWTTGPAGAIGGFGDVAEGEFYSEAVQWMVESGITSGTSPGCFSPLDAATRGQVATFIHRANGEPAAVDSEFGDISSGDFFAEAVGWMVASGITKGTSPTTFSPDRYVTRGELATFLFRAAGLPSSGAQGFADVSPGDFFAEAVGWMVAAGITTGTSPTPFSPDRYVTRREIATFMHRVAGSPATSLTAGGDCATSAAAFELAAAEARSLDLLNDLRAAVGVGPVVRLASMDALARAWSETMDLSGNFRHSSLPYSENIAWWSAGSVSPAEAARKMQNLWVNSPPHYTNMIEASHGSVGIGFWRSDDGWYATHVFEP